MIVVQGRPHRPARMGADVLDTVTSIANTVSGGEVDRVTAQIERLDTLSTVVVVASYVAGALSLAALLKGSST